MTARLVTAGHDRSDGGLLVTLLEMAFAGNCGLDIRLPALSSSGSSSGGSGGGVSGDGDDAAGVRGLVDLLFSEELGLVLEVLPANEEQVGTTATTTTTIATHAINTNQHISTHPNPSHC